mgnify:CR=1 FL=1
MERGAKTLSCFSTVVVFVGQMAPLLPGENAWQPKEEKDALKRAMKKTRGSVCTSLSLVGFVALQAC